MIIHKTDTSDLTTGPVARQLAALTFPLIYSSLGMMLFNVADIFFISKLGIQHIAALSFTFPVIMAIMSIAIGLEIGTTALISQTFGQKNHTKVKNLTTQCIILSLFVVLLFTIIGVFTIEPVFLMLGATPDLMPLIKDYMLIWYPGSLVLIIPMVGNSAIRSTGNTKFPSQIMVIAMITNVILDPIFIFGAFGIPPMGMKGAAFATVLSRTIMLVLSTNLLYSKLDMISLNIFSLPNLWKNWKTLLYISLPVGLTNILIPISFGFILSLIAANGEEAIAAYGIATRLEGFLLVIVMAIGLALAPFVGQNWGAGKYKRVELAVKYSYRFIVFWGIFIWIMLDILSVPLISLFSDNEIIKHIASVYYFIIAWVYGFRGVLRISTTILSIIIKPIDSSFFSILQSLVLLIPLGFIGNYFWGLNGIFAALALSYLISGNAAYMWLQKKIKLQILLHPEF